jgi:hypothetical protein
LKWLIYSESGGDKGKIPILGYHFAISIRGAI